ncbi:lysophospholipid acyltransferase family protein [Bradymonas sediminis]|uniref:lysophospholipid acyltransferase family protein n=1 Tax=Bradymonas sediminis TaxID=1548548 RepID=UPI0010EC95A8|nr:lysophospholipid acyltransferase family protein [Bradymonas sediminis]TDP63593.1 acyltransferase-like protein [Bradymonas sediminis]
MKYIPPQSPIADPRWTLLAQGLARVAFGLPRRTKLVLEGEENLPSTPALFAPNHSHKFDFLPLRYLLLKRKMHLVTWIKAREFKDPRMAKVLWTMGNIPLSSRGFLISADFESLVGRRPTEEEYRRLRACVDEGHSLPRGEVYERMLTTPREMLGVSFDPGVMTYRQAQRGLYYRVMQGTLKLARECMGEGHHMHFYPQGAVSSRLTPGKVGVIEAALALDLPIIPVGISGCRETFVGQGALTRKGVIRVEIGAPIHVDRAQYGAGFRPFHPDDEDGFRELLQADADRVMARINDLVDPAYRFSEEAEYDGKRGIARFY